MRISSVLLIVDWFELQPITFSSGEIGDQGVKSVNYRLAIVGRLNYCLSKFLVTTEATLADESAKSNLALATYLAEAGWSPRKLGHELNRLFGKGTVSVTAPYHWRDSGGIPRGPLPDFTAKGPRRV